MRSGRVADVAESVAQFGDRYLRRIYTEREIAACAGPAFAERLAARFAAKEAVIKALTIVDAPTPLTEIEIVGAVGCRGSNSPAAWEARRTAWLERRIGVVVAHRDPGHGDGRGLRE